MSMAALTDGQVRRLRDAGDHDALAELVRRALVGDPKMVEMSKKMARRSVKSYDRGIQK